MRSRTLLRGYDFGVSHGGANLSTDQAQLVSFARAVAADADLVAFEEAAGSVDSMAEYPIKQALVRIYETRTVIAIALRLSTVHRADRIVVLDAGEVAETGAHAELVRLGGIYTRLLGEHGYSPDHDHTTMPRTSHETTSGTFAAIRSCFRVK